jgi:hypothetical protein
MKEQIETHKIFLDTSIFIKENFFAGNKLKAFLKRSRISEIELITTSITIKETLANIDKFAREASSVLRKSLREIDNKSKIFKNISSLSSLFMLKDEFNIEKEIEILKADFEKLIEEHFTIIPIASSITEKVIGDYFNYSPPFKNGKKKSEFPDAFVLNSLEVWCDENNEKMYVVAEDEDIISYESKHLIPIREYDKLLEQISFTFSQNNMQAKVEELLEKHEDEIIRTVIEHFEDEFPHDGFDSTFGYEYDILSLGCTIGRKKFVDFLDFNLSVLLRNFSIQIHYSSTHCWFFCK